MKNARNKGEGAFGVLYLKDVFPVHKGAEATPWGPECLLQAGAPGAPHALPASACHTRAPAQLPCSQAPEQSLTQLPISQIKSMCDLIHQLYRSN